MKTTFKILTFFVVFNFSFLLHAESKNTETTKNTNLPLILSLNLPSNLPSNFIYFGIGLNGASNNIHNKYQAYDPYDSTGLSLAPSIFLGISHHFENNVVLGFEYDVNFIRLQKSDNVFSSKLSNMMNFSAILGYSFLDRKIIPFLSFGPSVGFYSVSSDLLRDDAQRSIPGLKAGAGFDVKIYSNLYFRAEYFYNHFWGNVNIAADKLKMESSVHNFRFGVSYRFSV